MKILIDMCCRMTGSTSVIQARTEDPVPAAIGEQVVLTITTYSKELERGALITIEPHRARVRILPLVPGLKPDE